MTKQFRQILASTLMNELQGWRLACKTCTSIPSIYIPNGFLEEDQCQVSSTDGYENSVHRLHSGLQIYYNHKRMPITVNTLTATENN